MRRAAAAVAACLAVLAGCGGDESGATAAGIDDRGVAAP
jgi:hypothetical protein